MGKQQIIVTRPQPQADEMAKLLSENNFNVVKTPLIGFLVNQDFQDHFDFSASQTADYLIFVSQQAAHYYLQALSDEQLATLNHKTIIAVGKATQETIASYGLSALVPQTFDSEGILTLLAEQNSEQKPLNILLVCGNQGRKLLEETLSKHHQLTRLEVYQRVAIAQRFPTIDEPENTAILVTSEQLLKLSLHQLSLQETPKMQTSDKSLLKTVAFICASSRIEQTAKQLGAVNCYTAQSAANQDMLAASLEWQNTIQNQQQSLLQSDAMSESDQHENEIIEALELDQDHESNEPKKKSSGFLKPIFWLLILGGLGYGGYWLWQQDYFQSASADDTAAELSRIVSLEKQLQDQNAQIERLITAQSNNSSQQTASLQELSRQIESLQQQLVASQRKFQSLSADAASQARDWQIAEAEYLIRQAAQKVHYSDDTSSIVALLEAADQQILASGDSNLLALRRAISQDIAQIRSTVAIDIDGVLVKLDAIESQLANLTLASVKFDPELSNNATDETVADPSAWQTFKTNVKDTFSDYYKVHHYDQSVKPFINPQQADLLKQNILMSIKMAQLAALRHQQSAYDKSMTELQNWIQEFYQADDQSALILQQLALLESAKVNIELPNKLQSLDLIKQNNQDRLNQWLQSPGVEAQIEETEAGRSGDINQTIQQTLERMESSDEQEDSGEEKEEPTPENDTFHNETLNNENGEQA
ncbi:MAG: uroporphyrinogen-III synthase [Gammaproteobacteria bacterium]|nr:uroporphyrinogen-III synthase [Gammaproteobacteria bacterium]